MRPDPEQWIIPDDTPPEVWWTRWLPDDLFVPLLLLILLVLLDLTLLFVHPY